MEHLAAGDPERVGRYRLIGRLGAGGMGRVYLGVSPSGRQVAVKVVREEIAQDPGFRGRFRREVELASRVGGFWTAAVIEADAESAVPWVASEYVRGPSLRDEVVANGPLSTDAVRALGVGLAEALGSLHGCGVVHRDLKPSNILLTSDGPRVIDFGISKALESGTVLTHTGTVMGTPGFMSPEQAVGTRVGTPSDVFSLGAVLVYAATGREPFGSGTPAALLYRVVSEAPDLTGVPEVLLPTVSRCLSKDAEERPSPSGVLALLAGEQPTEPLRGRPVTLLHPRPAVPEGPHPPPYGPDAVAPSGPGSLTVPYGPEPTAGAADTAALELVDGGDRRFRRIRARRFLDVLMWSAVPVLGVGTYVRLKGADLADMWLPSLVVYFLLCLPGWAYFFSAVRPFRDTSELGVSRDGIALTRGHDTARVPWSGLRRVVVSTGSLPHAVTVYCRLADDVDVSAVAPPARRLPLDGASVRFTMLAVDRAERNASCSEIHRAFETFAPDGTYAVHPRVRRRARLRESRRAKPEDWGAEPEEG